MLPKNLLDTLKKQHYRIIGNHTGVQVCNWTKNSLVNKGECYKEKFYGIKSHRCAEISPAIGFCENKCIHCWRAIELTVGDKINGIIDDPRFIINGIINERKKLLIGYKGNKNANKKKLEESEQPNHYAISLTGEPTLYPKIGELIKLLRKRKKTSFLVTNGLNPSVLKKLKEKKELPTQLYISLNSPNKDIYDKWHRSSVKDSWKKFNESLKILSKLKTRTVVRMTLVKDLNMKEEHINEYAKLIKMGDPDFIEVKGFMSVGFARKRLGYEKMPSHIEIKEFAKKLAKSLGKPYKILDEHIKSRIVLIGKDRKKMRIKPSEI
jgi:tRNA wybutosine-synthesizing protein 1